MCLWIRVFEFFLQEQTWINSWNISRSFPLCKRLRIFHVTTFVTSSKFWILFLIFPSKQFGVGDIVSTLFPLNEGQFWCSIWKKIAMSPPYFLSDFLLGFTPLACGSSFRMLETCLLTLTIRPNLGIRLTN